MRDLLTATLRAEGYQVVPARSGIEALERLGSARLGHRRFDAIVSDVRMPGPSGLEVLSGLRAAGERLPIVLITAFGSRETHARARRLGASAILDKPFLLETLVSVVQAVLRREAPSRCHSCGAVAEVCAADRRRPQAWCTNCWETMELAVDDEELGVVD